jgi:hypothetical protein
MDPKDLLNNPEQIKNLIAVLQSLLPSDANTQKETEQNDQEETDEEDGRTHKIKTKTRRRVGDNSKSGKPKKSKNKFEQMNEFNMHKDDTSIDKVLSKHPPVARMREFDPVSVVCRVCGKKEIVSPGLVFEGASRYKCNNCSTQAG